MTDKLRALAREVAFERMMDRGNDGKPDPNGVTKFVQGFIAGRTSVTQEQIAEVLRGHHFVHGVGRSNSCHCGELVVDLEDYRKHQASVVLALLRGETDV